MLCIEIILVFLLPLLISTTQIVNEKNQILNEYLNNLTFNSDELNILNITNTKFELDSIYLADYYCQNNQLYAIYLNLNNLKYFSFKSKSNDLNETECVSHQNIKILNLNNNNLKELNKENFLINENNYPFNIEVLLLQSNELESIDKQIFNYLINLKYLDLSNNKLKQFYFYTNSLILLDLSNNQLDNFIQSTSRKIQHLYLDNYLTNKKLSNNSKRPIIVNNYNRNHINNQSYHYYISKLSYDLLLPSFNSPGQDSFETYRLQNLTLNCNVNDTSKKSLIIWNTTFGYMTYFNYSSQINDDFKILLNNLFNISKISSKIQLQIGTFDSKTKNELYVTPQNQLVLTKIRVKLINKIQCIALNEFGQYDKLDFNIKLKNTITEYYIYCLLVSLIVMIFSLCISVIICIICEQKAIDAYPMTPPVYPTPLPTNAPSTPPNFDFDFNQYATNIKLNISETLDQVSKKLRKGVETFKSIGVTSSAYIYSMYEQSSQRLQNIKMPNLSVPVVRYPAMGDFTQRMTRLRTGMADVFIQLREFCGSSDLAHTASIATIESDCNALSAVGRTSIMDLDNHLKLLKENNQEFNRQK